MKMKFRRKILIAYIHHIQNQGYFYGIRKIHKALDGRIPNFRPICPSNFVRPTSWQISVITYSKHWPLMNLIEDGSFSFAKEIEGFVSHLVMAILM